MQGAVAADEGLIDLFPSVGSRITIVQIEYCFLIGKTIAIQLKGSSSRAIQLYGSSS